MTRTQRRITAIIGHLETCAAHVERAEHELAEKEESAAWGTRAVSQSMSTMSSRHIGDPTGTRALSADNQISTEQRRDLTDTLATIERNVTHLRHLLARTAGTSTTDTSKEQRCPDMILEHDGHDYVNRQCGVLTHCWQRGDGSTAFRQDGRCIDHGTEHDTAERRRADSDARRLRRHAS